MSGGPANWQDLLFRHGGVWLDGVQIFGGFATPLVSLPVLSGAVSTETLGQVDQVQMRMLGAKAPVGAPPAEIPIRFTVDQEEEYELFLTRCERGFPVELWPAWPLFDQWYLPARDVGQTEFEPRRKFPWGAISGISHATRPPIVKVDGVEQAIVTSGMPGTGEVLVPDASGYQVIEAPAALTGTWLQLAYWPIFDVRFEEVGQAYEQHNELVFDVKAREVRLRVHNA